MRAALSARMPTSSCSPLRWNHSSHPSPWIRMIARPPRNKMNVTVHHSLTGDLSTVESHIEAHHSRVRFANKGTRFHNQPVTST